MVKQLYIWAPALTPPLLDANSNQLSFSTLYSLLAMDDLFRDLDETLSALEQTPDNVALLRNQLRLMKELSMDTEYLDTLLRLSSLVMLDEGGMTSRSS